MQCNSFTLQNKKGPTLFAPYFMSWVDNYMNKGNPLDAEKKFDNTVLRKRTLACHYKNGSLDYVWFWLISLVCKGYCEIGWVFLSNEQCNYKDCDRSRTLP